MITVWGEGRGFRVVWMLEELGLAYRVRDVDLLHGIENDTEFRAINPAGYIPAIEDGDTVMVESIAILQYLLARHGPSPLAPEPDDPSFAPYLQFLHMGEAGLAMPMNIGVASIILAPEGEKDNWGARWGRSQFESRLRLVRRQLERAPYMAGDSFTAADISVTYALQFARRTIGFPLGEAEQAYVKRTTGRPAYARAMDSCPGTKAWAASVGG